MDTNLLILLIAVLFVILFAGGMLLYRQSASGELKFWIFSYRFHGSNTADSSKKQVPPTQATAPHTNVSNVQVEGSGDVRNETGKSTHVTHSTFGGDLTVISSNPTPVVKGKDKSSKS